MFVLELRLCFHLCIAFSLEITLYGLKNANSILQCSLHSKLETQKKKKSELFNSLLRLVRFQLASVSDISYF